MANTMKKAEFTKEELNALKTARNIMFNKLKEDGFLTDPLNNSYKRRLGERYGANLTECWAILFDVIGYIEG